MKTLELDFRVGNGTGSTIQRQQASEKELKGR